MKRLCEIFVLSNTFISLTACCLFTYYAIILDINFFLEHIVLAFGLTNLAYNSIRIISIKSRNESNSKIDSTLRWYQDHYTLTLFQIFLSLILIGISVVNLSLNQIIFLGIAIIITILYQSLFIPWFNLRKFAYFKPFFIALAWSCVCVGLNFTELNWAFIVNFIDCFIFISILCIAYDFKDEADDKLQSLKTISQLFKRKGEFIIFMTLLNAVYLLLYNIFISEKVFHFQYIFMMAFVLYPLYQKQFAKAFPNYLFILLIDSIIIFKSTLLLGL